MGLLDNVKNAVSGSGSKDGNTDYVKQAEGYIGEDNLKNIKNKVGEDNYKKGEDYIRKEFGGSKETAEKTETKQ